MGIRVALTHSTTYRFDRAVTLHPHVVRLRPAPHTRTPIEAYSLTVEPDEHWINWQQDPFGNFLARLVFNEPARELSVVVDLVADMTPINPFDFFLEPEAEEFPFSYEPELHQELAPYLRLDEPGPLLAAYLATVDRRPRRVNDFLVDLNQQLSRDIAYTVRMEPGVQTPEQTLDRAIGSCRDTGWLLVQMLRHLGLAARFVSGYLVQLTSDVKALDGPSGPEADFTDLHAWAEVFLPGAGWVGLDPTSGLFAGEGHIPLAATPEPSNAAPITGATSPCESTLEFVNEVRRVREDPRVTKPYTEEQWAHVDEVGRQVDERLRLGDVRLTMGGEPTFVSVDDMSSPQWTTAADGPDKRRLADQLTGRLLERFGAGGVVHQGQGKWYPGEPLPRWARTIYWRPDGVPVWRKPELMPLGDPAGTGESADAADAGRFGRALCRRLELGESALISAYEDPIAVVWEEARVPADVDPADLDPERADLDEVGHRRRLAQLLDRGPTTPSGYVLPLGWDGLDWVTSTWPLRRDRLFLVPGDSPMGFRLPLGSLPAVAETVEPPPEPDPFAPPRSLPVPDGTDDGRTTVRPIDVNAVSPSTAPSRPATVPQTAPAGFVPMDADLVRTALCIEPRQGALWVFFPPLNDLGAWLSLVAAIEDTAAELDLPVRIEGYEPPRDARLQRLAVTPDPGVIEVNVQPTSTWDEMSEVTTELYDLAHHCRLGTERFDLDGRHTGTGGGNHVTLGGMTPPDSPLLRRPDLLRSLLTYWQHHPGLSYLFSGAFIGPTSQAPRVDEARHENLYELEIAFEQIDAATDPPPWIVDRMLRHLLVDLTGNTHRAEFCIDKLFSPDSASGRLGLVELRAFEMPPHPRMSLVQMLLVRSLVARFWDHPYRRPLVRWGTRLHDRFMLAHYVTEDITEVCQELRDAGIDFRTEWMDPFIEFRFPRLGTVQVGPVALELRQAIEPWHVLGEEVSQFGTARYVDSSVERLQVRVTGVTDTRHVVTCNGRLVPLRSTTVAGEYVAGVRYRAWAPPSALHPTIGVHAPLVFDVIDRWTGRSIGGCVYHVTHPGGLAYETFPVNSYEADSRRVSRFWDMGHTPGTRTALASGMASRTVEPRGPSDVVAVLGPKSLDPEYPHTLDLRQAPGGPAGDRW